MPPTSRNAHYIAVLLAIGLIASSRLAGQPGPQKYSSVTIEVVGSHGGPQLGGSIEIFSEGVKVYSEQHTYEATAHLPFGKYTVVFKDIYYLFEPASREVTVDRPECFFVLMEPSENLNTDFSSSKLSAVRVQVQAAKTCAAGPLWAKMVGVYSQYSEERKIGPDGSALFDEVNSGLYLVMIVEADQPRALKEVEILGGVTKVDVTLRTCNPPPQ